MVSLGKEFTVRPATLVDVEAAVALSNACAQELIGRPWDTVDEYRNDWQSPAINLVGQDGMP